MPHAKPTAYSRSSAYPPPPTLQRPLYVPGRVLVQLHATRGTASLNSIAPLPGLELAAVLGGGGLAVAAAAGLDGRQQLAAAVAGGDPALFNIVDGMAVEDKLQQIQRLSSVAWAGPDTLAYLPEDYLAAADARLPQGLSGAAATRRLAQQQPGAAPAVLLNDPYFSNQFHLPMIDAPEAWASYGLLLGGQASQVRWVPVRQQGGRHHAAAAPSLPRLPTCSACPHASLPAHPPARRSSSVWWTLGCSGGTLTCRSVSARLPPQAWGGHHAAGCLAGF